MFPRRFSMLQSRIFKRSMFIQTHTTPNPNALKFTPNLPPNSPLAPANIPTVEVSSIKEALMKSDLAFKLLSIDDKRISSILLGSDFITVVKTPQADDWSVLKPQIFSVLTEHLAMGQSALKPEYLEKATSELINADEDADLSEQEEIIMLIKELIQTRIRPAILEDGGDVVFVNFNFETGTVYLKLIGACKSCGSSEVTLKNGIEEMLRYYIDEVNSVEQIKDEDDETDSHNHDHSQDSKTFQKHSLDDLPPSL